MGELVGVVLGVGLCVDGLGGGAGLAHSNDDGMALLLLLVFMFKDEWLRFEDAMGQGEFGSEIETGTGLVGRAMVVVGVKNGIGGTAC